MMLRQDTQNFLQYLRFEKRYSVHTLTAYETDLEQFIVFISEQFDLSDASQINHFHVRSWLAALKDQGQTARSLNRKMSALNSFYKYLLKHGAAAHNPVSRLHAMRLPERLPVYLKETETENFLELPFDDSFKGFTDRLICELLYQAGLRRSELMNLKENSIAWSLKHIRVLGKGNKERLLPVSDNLLDVLKQYLREKENIENADRNYLLICESGARLYPEYIYRVVKKYLTLSVTLKKKSPHVLRHTFATHLLSHGANLQAIKELLGHSSLAATQVYTHNNIEKLKEIHKLSHPRG